MRSLHGLVWLALGAAQPVLAQHHGHEDTSTLVVDPARLEDLTARSPLDDVVAYMCPIHSDYTATMRGTCPRDGMPLVPATPFDVRDYELDMQAVPAVPEAGEAVTLTLEVRHPGDGERVHDFALVHDRRYHLFVISQDMSYFEHVHPTQNADGTWSIDVVLPRAGYYKVLSDFLPRDGTAQFIARPLVTAGYTGDVVADRPSLAADTATTKTVGGLTASLSFDPPTFVAGLYGHLNFFLTDARTGKPVADLQAYLGAFGHTLILSEDMVDYVHSHPLDLGAGFDEENGPMLYMIPMGVDPETLRGGPDVTFDGLMPRAGRFRAFTQFRWRNELHTFAFSFDVVDAP